MSHLRSLWAEDRGVLSFEWILLITLLTVGIVIGVAAVRDTTIDEFGDVAQAMMAVDQSYIVAFPLAVTVHTASTSGASDSSFTDRAIYEDCDRPITPVGQDYEEDVDS